MTQPKDIVNPIRWSDIRRNMTPAERMFACCLSRGLQCRLGNAVPEVSTPRNTVRAEVVRFFAHKGDEDHCIRGTEIFLRGAWVEGHLDLLFAHIPYALLFYRCHFDSDVNVIRAECPALYMSGSRLSGGLKGDGMKVSGGIFMRNGFSAKGKVQLLGANVGGNLNCFGGEFQNSDDGALIANHAKVGGGVFLGRKFAAGGEVRLIGADIGGNLNCSGGQFVAKVRRAINASRAKIGGDVLLNEGFYANGEVRLFGASVSGKMDCAGGQFVNPGDEGEHGERIYALNAELVKTGGHVYLNKRTPEGEDGPFIAYGRVRFANAHIGGNFNCKGGRFRHSGKRSALAAGGLKSRAVFLSEEFSAEGEVALHVAHIGNFVCAGCVPNDKSPITINLSSTEAAAVDDDEESWKPFNFLLDGFTYDTFYGRSPTDSTRRLEWLSKRPGKRTLKDGTEVDIPFSPLPYEQAAKVLFEMGHDNDAREILLKKEQEVTKRKNWWHKPYRWLWGEFAGYGYKPGRLLMWALAVVGIGWGVFSHAAEIGRYCPPPAGHFGKPRFPNAE